VAVLERSERPVPKGQLDVLTCSAIVDAVVGEVEPMLNVDDVPEHVQSVPWPKYATPRIERWQQIHEKLVGLAKRRAGQDYEEGRWLLRGMKAAVHRALGYGSYLEYVERIFGYAPRVAAERIRVARALQELPLMREALRTASIPWSVAREVTRVAVADTEQQWLDAVQGKSVRQVEKMVAGRKPGDGPDDPRDETARRYVVRFEIGGDVLALLRDARAELVRRTGRHLEDDDLVRMLAAGVLGGPGDEGRSPYQIAMTICARCGAGKQEGAGESLPVTAEVVERARCDAQHVGPVGSPSATRERASQTIPPAVRRAVLRRHGGRCAVPGCSHAAFIELHHLDRRAEGGTHDPNRLVPLCSAHHAAEHEGRLIIEGDAVHGFRFYHADRTAYGATTAPGRTVAWADAFSMLRNLGYKEGEIRSALEAIRSTVHVEADTEAVVRAALAELRTDRASPGSTEEIRARPGYRVEVDRGDAADAGSVPPRGTDDGAPVAKHGVADAVTVSPRGGGNGSRETHERDPSDTSTEPPRGTNPDLDRLLRAALREAHQLGTRARESQPGYHARSHVARARRITPHFGSSGHTEAVMGAPLRVRTPFTAIATASALAKEWAGIPANIDDPETGLGP
jgi:hypothetical protein